ncbi:glycosyltransferase family protein [Gorillibacterium timonense]|uniref:UDP-glucuronosyltransferase n=1 Tax=Gorillibacterium timonense TaxID=1689269 RepID=UPI000AA93B83|nr:UDP-glucuronosyltransferase [Gorillibacterium timonense]
MRTEGADESAVITVLCSGFGLGLYIPGLLIADRLRSLGRKTVVEVFETAIQADKQEGILRSKQACHRSFAVAKMSARMPMDIAKSVDPEAVERLIGEWEAEDRRHFLLLSGHWLHIVNHYRQRRSPVEIHADILYVDGGLPPSWESVRHYEPDYARHYGELRLYDTERAELLHPIQVGCTRPVPYGDRLNRCLIHGGGWGMGTYRTKIPELREHGFELDLVAYEHGEEKEAAPGDRVFRIDPDWSPWLRNAEDHFTFPPFGRIHEDGTADYRIGSDHHGLFDIASRVKAIIGKPGAGTMIDSLGSATPLVLLEPFGEHEKRNAELWEALGFGISYEKWKESGFSDEPLIRLYERLAAARESKPDLALAYSRRLAGGVIQPKHV